MKFVQLLFVLFLLVPIAEIFVLIQVGGIIGPLPTIVLIVLTAVAGAALIRHQGITTLARIQGELAQAQLPAEAVLEGACLLVAGALLMTPGFVTDSFGFALLVPPLRRLLIRSQAHRVLGATLRGSTHRTSGAPKGAAGDGLGTRRPSDGHIIEGEYEVHDESK